MTARTALAALPVRAAGALLLAGLALYATGFDQGALVTAVSSGVDAALTHELLHDARHMLGFPCH